MNQPKLLIILLCILIAAVMLFLGCKFGSEGLQVFGFNPTMSPTSNPTIYVTDNVPITAPTPLPTATPKPTPTPDLNKFTPAVFKPDPKIKKAPKDTIILSFAGDFTLGTDISIPENLSFPAKVLEKKNKYSYFLKNVRPVFEADDMTLVNLEGNLTYADKMAEKKFRFKGDPLYTNILRLGSIDMVNISNNHIYDYLDVGFNDTIRSLKWAGIKYSGEGTVETFWVKDKKIVSMGFNAWDVNIEKGVGSRIQAVRNNADIVVVSFHGGTEYSYSPNEVQIKLSRSAVDAGADVVVWHHPHVVQGIEFYKGRYIAYSLGNFCYGGNEKPRDFDTMIFQNSFKFEKGKLVSIQPNIIPCSISSDNKLNNYQPTILKDKEAKRVLDKIAKMSLALEFGLGKPVPTPSPTPKPSPTPNTDEASPSGSQTPDDKTPAPSDGEEPVTGTPITEPTATPFVDIPVSTPPNETET